MKILTVCFVQPELSNWICSVTVVEKKTHIDMTKLVSFFVNLTTQESMLNE